MATKAAISFHRLHRIIACVPCPFSTTRALCMAPGPSLQPTLFAGTCQLVGTFDVNVDVNATEILYAGTRYPERYLYTMCSCRRMQNTSEEMHGCDRYAQPLNVCATIPSGTGAMTHGSPGLGTATCKQGAWPYDQASYWYSLSPTAMHAFVAVRSDITEESLGVMFDGVIDAASTAFRFGRYAAIAFVLTPPVSDATKIAIWQPPGPLWPPGTQDRLELYFGNKNYGQTWTLAMPWPWTLLFHAMLDKNETGYGEIPLPLNLTLPIETVSNHACAAL